MCANSDRPVFGEYAEFRADPRSTRGDPAFIPDITGFLSQFQKLGETVNRLLTRSVEGQVCIQTVRPERPDYWFALSACDPHV